MADNKTLVASLTIRAVDQASATLGRITGAMSSINKSGRDWAQTSRQMMVAGAAISGAGFGGLYAVKKMTDAYGEWQQLQAHIRTTMDEGAAATGDLAEEQRVLTAMSDKGVVSALNLGHSYYIARSNLLNHVEALAAVKAANDLVTGTTLDAAEANAEAEQTTRMLTEAYNVFGDKTKAAVPQLSAYADQLSKLQTRYGFKNIGEVQYAEQYAMPQHALAGVDMAQQNAVLAVLAAGGKYSAEAGTAYQELVQTLTTDPKMMGFWTMNAKGGMDLIKTLGNLSAATRGYTYLQREKWLQALGFQGASVAALALVIDGTGKLKTVEDDLRASTGAAAENAKINTATTEAKFAELSNQWVNLKVALGATVGGSPLATIAGGIAKVVSGLTWLIETYPRATKFAMIFFIVGAAILAVVGTVVALTGTLIALATFIGIPSAFVAGFALVGIAISLVVAAFGTFHAQLKDIWAILMYEPDFSKVWSGIVSVFHTVVAAIWNFGASMYTAGAHLMAELGHGIVAGAMAPVHAIIAVAKRIRAHLPFSPAETGPLADLHRVRIVQTIAETMHPAPVVSAMRRVAAAAAVAIPLAISPVVAPMYGPSRAIASSVAPITVTFNVDLRGAGAGLDVDRVKREMDIWLRGRGYELAEVLRREQARRERSTI